MDKKLSVFFTGATGRVGSVLYPAFKERYSLRTLYRSPMPDDPDATIGDLSDIDMLREALKGAEVLVHLAAVSRMKPFETLLPANIVGAYNIMQAAVDAGVRRIVYASSCNTVSWKNTKEIIRETDPLNPYSLYGVTKGFGELLGRCYQIRSGIEFLTVRIGWLLPYDDPDLRILHEKRRIWLSPRDAVDFFTRAVEMPVKGSPVLFATSRTSPQVVSLDAAREILGYEPHDSVPPLDSEGSAGSS